MLCVSCLEEELVEGVTRIIGKDDDSILAKKEKF